IKRYRGRTYGAQIAVPIEGRRERFELSERKAIVNLVRIAARHIVHLCLRERGFNPHDGRRILSCVSVARSTQLQQTNQEFLVLPANLFRLLVVAKVKIPVGHSKSTLV